MCFSAAASFTASAVLGAAGVHTLSQSKTRQNFVLATIPFVFTLQQFFEGFVWILPAPSKVSLLAAYTFVFFAFLFWPSYIPFACWMHEKKSKRKNVLLVFVVLGFIGSAYLLVSLFLSPLEVVETGRSIQYLVDVPLEMVGISIYIAVTVGAFLIASDPFLKVFGLLVGISAWVSWTFYTLSFTSVWCFFSALLSILIWVHILKPKWSGLILRFIK
jgi:hypothetical protein